MRPVNKGDSPKIYARYGDAKEDLVAQIGSYCSYCEMALSHMIEVEHVIPLIKAGAELDWDNFLLACKYCNTIKGSRNNDRNSYIWPDEDNSDLAFQYTEYRVIYPAAASVQVMEYAKIQSAYVAWIEDLEG